MQLRTRTCFLAQFTKDTVFLEYAIGLVLQDKTNTPTHTCSP